MLWIMGLEGGQMYRGQKLQSRDLATEQFCLLDW